MSVRAEREMPREREELSRFNKTNAFSSAQPPHQLRAETEHRISHLQRLASLFISFTL